LVVRAPELQFVEAVPGSLGHLNRRLSYGHSYHHSIIVTYINISINYLMFIDNNIGNIYYNITIYTIARNNLIILDNSLYRPVQICM